jgi:hypothetical protein
MTVLFVILGGAVGGGMGWLFDRLVDCRREETGAPTAKAGGTRA